MGACAYARQPDGDGNAVSSTLKQRAMGQKGARGRNDENNFRSVPLYL
jgi:hypothetical protein